jgi:hypothetical protein
MIDGDIVVNVADEKLFQKYFFKTVDFNEL